MTAKIIPFPDPPKPEPPILAHVAMSPAHMFELNDCTNTVHFFYDLDEACKCGQERWPKGEEE